MVNVIFTQTLEICSKMFQFTHIVDLRCFLERIVVKATHCWRSNLLEIAKKFFHCNIKINKTARTSERQIYILSNILIRACTGISLNVIDGQHRMLYFIYHLLGIKNIQTMYECFNCQATRLEKDFSQRMASMSIAPISIVNHNWKDIKLTVVQQLSMMRKISAKKQYDMEQTVKTSILQVITIINAQTKEAFSQNGFTPLLCLNLNSHNGQAVWKTLDNAGVFKTKKAHEIWTGKVTNEYISSKFESWVGQVMGTPQSIFAKMINNTAKLQNQKISIEILAFPEQKDKDSTSLILPFTACLFKIFFMSVITIEDFSILEHIIRNKIGDKITYSVFAEQNFSRRQEDMQLRPLPNTFEMVCHTLHKIKASCH